eukprot:3784829-Rhodomonas_salina.1
MKFCVRFFFWGGGFIRAVGGRYLGGSEVGACDVDRRVPAVVGQRQRTSVPGITYGVRRASVPERA